MFSRDKIAKVAAEIADHLQIIENIKAIQIAQKEMANAVSALGTKINSIEIELRAMKAEMTLVAVREAQNIVNTAQGNLNQRIEDVAVKVAIMDRDVYGIDNTEINSSHQRSSIRTLAQAETSRARIAKG